MQNLKTRLSNFKKIDLNNNTTFLTDVNYMNSTLIFQTSISKKEFGIIKEVYGDCRLVYSEPSKVKGLFMESFMPDCMAEGHRKAALNFIENPIVPIIGDNIKKGVIRFPGTPLVDSCGITLKVVPTKVGDYSFITAAKIDLNSTKMYLIVNQQLKIVGYSATMEELFEEPDSYLLQDQNLKDVSSKLARAISVKLKARTGFGGVTLKDGQNTGGDDDDLIDMGFGQSDEDSHF